MKFLRIKELETELTKGKEKNDILNQEIKINKSMLNEKIAYIDDLHLKLVNAQTVSL